MPAATLRSWVLGRSYDTSTGSRFFQPLIDLADKKRRCLSFCNLIEAFTLNAMRRTQHRISMPSVRKALDCVKRQTKEKSPLLTEKFLTDGVDLFLDKYGQLVAVSKDGQLAIRAVMMDSLAHVRRDSKGMPSKLYLFVAPAAKPDAKPVEYKPSVYVLSSGEVTPFTAIFRAPDDETEGRVKIDAFGNRVEIDEARRG